MDSVLIFKGTLSWLLQNRLHTAHTRQAFTSHHLQSRKFGLFERTFVETTRQLKKANS